MSQIGQVTSDSRPGSVAEELRPAPNQHEAEEARTSGDTVPTAIEQSPIDPQRVDKGLRWRKLGPSLRLENTGSVARDHLANERTWLAYLRTSLALASMGVALVQLFTISSIPTDTPDTTPRTSPSPALSISHRFARPLGALTIAFAVLFLIAGAHRYFTIQHALANGNFFPPARKAPLFMGVGLLGVVGVVFGVVIAGR